MSVHAGKNVVVGGVCWPGMSWLDVYAERCVGGVCSSV